MYYFVFSMYVLEAQLFSNDIDVTDSLLRSLTPSLTGRVVLSGMTPLWWIDMDVVYGFAIYNLMRKPFLKVSWHIPVFFLFVF